MNGLNFMASMTCIYDRQFQERQLKILRKKLLQRDTNNVFATDLCERMKNAFGLRTLPSINDVLPFIHFTHTDSHETRVTFRNTQFTLIYMSSSLNPFYSICDHYFGHSMIQLQREVYQLICNNNLNVSEEDEDDADEEMVNIDDDYVNGMRNDLDEEENDTLSDTREASLSDPDEDDDDEMINEINSNIYQSDFKAEKMSQHSVNVSSTPECLKDHTSSKLNCNSCESTPEKVTNGAIDSPEGSSDEKKVKSECKSVINHTNAPSASGITNTIVPFLNELTHKVPHSLLQLYMDHTMSASIASNNLHENTYTDHTSGNSGQAKRGPGRPRKHPSSLDKKYVCERCFKSFNVRSHLESHMVTHTGEKKYTCKYCGNKFTQSSSLRNHVIAIHTRNFPHVCSICHKGFLLPSQLKKHKGLLHSEKSRTCFRPLTQ